MSARARRPGATLLAAGSLILQLAACAAHDGDRAGPPGAHSIPRGAEALSLDGRPLSSPPLPAQRRAALEADLAAARAAFERNPRDLESIVWLGRRLAYVGRFNDAIEIFTKGLEAHPDGAELLRHRGHRFITIRRFRRAEEDLSRAAGLVRGKPDVVEADGQPNERNVPIGTLQHNIHYHLGLARYLLGDFDGALAAFRDCLAVSKNPDARASAMHWIYCSLQWLGRGAEAEASVASVEPGWDIIENHAYYNLLLLYRGALSPSAALGGRGASAAAATYGVANWYRFHGDEARAISMLRELLSTGDWPAFGFIAAEAEFARLGLAIPAPPR